METVMPVQARGPLAGVVMERLSAWLAAEKYAKTMVPQVLGVARGLSVWMEECGADFPTLTSEHFDAFGAFYGPGVPGHAIVQARLSVLRRFFIEIGVLSAASHGRARTRRPVGQAARTVGEVAAGELDQWARWQREARGISEGCIRHRRAWVCELVDSLPVRGHDVDWSACDVTALNAFITQRSEGFSTASCTALVDATRSLMRWALATGRVDRDLTGGVLRTRTSRVTLPRGLSSEQVHAMLHACNTATVSGLRDRAVITVLWRLGLRAGEAARLSLDDTDWAAGRITVVGKGQRRLTLPLSIDVAEALIAWLRSRPDTADRAVFVRMRPPIGALTTAGISGIVKHRGMLRLWLTRFLMPPGRRCPS